MISALDLFEIARRLGAEYAGPPVRLTGAAVDSRRVTDGDLFIATRGEHVDGHDFVDAAAQRGAAAALVERPLQATIPCIQVRDSLAALTEVGRANRAAFAGQVVAITGSCGKTTVKNMCREIFAGAGSTVATAGNYNNEIGVPLTLAQIGDDTRFAIVEMGATGRGDVAYLCDLARPTVAAVLNAMEAHLAGFGSVADVADVKAEILDGLGADGVAVLALDSPWADLWRRRIEAGGARTVTWARGTDADVGALVRAEHGAAGTDLTLRIRGDARELRLPLPGRHNVANALAAAALATAAGLSIDVIAAGLSQARGEAGRLQTETLADGTTLIDDSYNANPGSVRAAIAVLADAAGPHALVLGEMLELGADSAELHAEMGRLARDAGIERLLGVGPALAPAVEVFGTGAALYADREAAREALPGLLAECRTILVKGSRGAAMEQLIVALRAAAREVATC